jgi:hypothetical protein
MSNDLKEMKRTIKYIRFGGMLSAYLSLLLEILVTYSDYICYFFMLLSMMNNAGIISLVYPFMVLGYAIMEETSPTKRFWHFTLIYTVSLILLKFVYQLEFWSAIFTTERQ